MSLARRLRYRWDRLTGRVAARQKAAHDAFDAVCAALAPGDLAVDLGANIGDFTEKLAKTGAEVVAFEPDPVAFDLLKERMAPYPNVETIRAAAAAADGQMQLHRTAHFDSDPVRHTTSSSLLADKRNVAGGGAVTVQVIDFVQWLTDRDRDVPLIKMDIEGAEVEIMERLLDAPVRTRIGHIFIETHERAIPRLAGRIDALKLRSADMAHPKINWDWQ